MNLVYPQNSNTRGWLLSAHPPSGISLLAHIRKAPQFVGLKALVTLCDDSILHVTASTTRLINQHTQLLSHATSVLHILESINATVVFSDYQSSAGERRIGRANALHAPQVKIDFALLNDAVAIGEGVPAVESVGCGCD